jgi:hypothetical protein
MSVPEANPLQVVHVLSITEPRYIAGKKQNHPALRLKWAGHGKVSTTASIYSWEIMKADWVEKGKCVWH